MCSLFLFADEDKSSDPVYSVYTSLLLCAHQHQLADGTPRPWTAPGFMWPPVLLILTNAAHLQPVPCLVRKGRKRFPRIRVLTGPQALLQSILRRPGRKRPANVRSGQRQQADWPLNNCDVWERNRVAGRGSGRFPPGLEDGCRWI